MYPYALALLFAAAATALLTPVAMRLAQGWGFLDRPNTSLKVHAKPVPYLGGLAMAAGFAAAVLAVKWRYLPAEGFAPWPLGLEKLRGVLAILLGGGIALGLGLVDDRHALSPQVKFLGQTLGAGVLVLVGLRLRFVHPEWLAVPLTILWVVAITNAMNFVDIMDGLAASVGAAASLGFLAFALNAGRYNDSLAAAALAGCCLGFLAFNWSPAKVYMGDAGSHFLGFCLAAIALNLQYSHQNALAVFSPLAILALPVFDVLLMTVIRLRKGIPPWKGSPDHVPLRLRALGLSKEQVVLILTGLTLALSALTYVASFFKLGTALLVWAALGLAAVLAGAWLMSIPMAPAKSGRGKRGP